MCINLLLVNDIPISPAHPGQIPGGAAVVLSLVVKLVENPHLTTEIQAVLGIGTGIVADITILFPVSLV